MALSPGIVLAILTTPKIGKVTVHGPDPSFIDGNGNTPSDNTFPSDS